ncbi:exosortase-associated protein EpsI, B-type [Accumulibacter sp.]|jgi:EpsI family protein|uniref:exosortase-associated protein EpsI, B-type n=1 Tax=Accumulibacter sp. TaxID=2053492 RepID=UPI001AC79342|nr:exosortase-associated protein EpsI, B-type [Accumulibacter sp.]MBN8455593.1 EpsI family protein [Accumulibacter sp.]MBO3705858.1 EpsI family protein [Candidatus Accumulibacter conexus]
MKPLVRNLILLLLMLASSGLAIALKPTQRIADHGPRIDLQAVVPRQFGDWKIDPLLIPVSVSPDVQERLDAIYDQTLARTYVNSRGQRVMLSIAYGGDQGSDKTQVHRPEFCYAAQGFQLSKSFENEVAMATGGLPVRRLAAVQGTRNEPITYWITVGDQVALPGISRKLLQIRYGITGKVPDGMLVRVSSIGDQAPTAYALHDEFIKDMLAAATADDRVRLAGRAAR